MDSYLSLEKPGMLPIIIKPRTSRLGIAILTSFDFLSIVYLFFPIEAKDADRREWRRPLEKLSQHRCVVSASKERNLHW
jgi:hypothetical protein